MWCLEVIKHMNKPKQSSEKNNKKQDEEQDPHTTQKTSIVNGEKPNE